MKARRVKGLDPGRSLAENAARITRVRLDEMRGFARKALKPGGARAQHNMRIAAKRLRYVLEATEFCFGSAGPAARRRARDLQDLLGEIHDCDVMLPRVERQVTTLRDVDADAIRARAGEAGDLDPELSARAPHRTAYRGLEVLSVHLTARRALLFERFVEFWEAQERAGTWTRLERSAERVIEEARERRRAAKRAEQARRELEAAERAEHEAAERAQLAATELAAARREAERDGSDRDPAGPRVAPATTNGDSVGSEQPSP